MMVNCAFYGAIMLAAKYILLKNGLGMGAGW